MRIPARTPDEIAAAIPRVLEHLNRDGLIAYPTETVYGFGGAVTPDAVARLRELKRREAAKPFLILISEPGQAPGVHWTETAREVARRCWPGPLTLALSAPDGAFPEGIVSEHGTVALRSSPHPFVQALTRAAGAITSTSANAPGTRPARNTQEIEQALTALGASAAVLTIDGGELPPSPPSTIVAPRDGHLRVLREGAITTEQLRDQLAGSGIDVSQ